MKFSFIRTLSLLSSTVLLSSPVLSMENDPLPQNQISIQKKLIEGKVTLEKEINNLKNQLSKTNRDISEAESKRKKECQKLKEEKEIFILKTGAEKQLEELKVLDSLFFEQLSKSHSNSKDPQKRPLSPHMTLGEALTTFGESVKGISIALNTCPQAMEIIEKIFTLLYGKCSLPFTEAKQKIINAAAHLNNFQICNHLNGSNENFPHLEKLTCMYGQLVEDPMNFIIDQDRHCKEGLNGRMGLYVSQILQGTLSTGVKNPTLFPKTFALKENLHGPLLKEIKEKNRHFFANLEEQEKKREKEFELFSQQGKKEMSILQENLLKKQKELEKLAKNISEIEKSLRHNNLRALLPILLEESELESLFQNIGYQPTTAEVCKMMAFDTTEGPISEETKKKAYEEGGYILKEEATQERLEEEYKKQKRHPEFMKKLFEKLPIAVTNLETAKMLLGNEIEPTSENGKNKLYEWKYILEEDATPERFEEEYFKKKIITNPLEVQVSQSFKKLGEEIQDPYLANLFKNASKYAFQDNIFPKGTVEELSSPKACIQAAVFGAVIGDTMGVLTKLLKRGDVEKCFPEGLISFKNICSQIRPTETPGHKLFTMYSANKEGNLWKPTGDTLFSTTILEHAIESRKNRWGLEVAMQKLGFKFANLDTDNILNIGEDTKYACKQLKEISGDPKLLGGLWWRRGKFYWEIQRRIKNKKEEGNGSVLRAWPMGVIFYDDIEKASEWGASQSYLTHANPTAIGSSGALAAGIASSLQGNSVENVVKDMIKYAKKWEALARKVKEEDPSLEVHDLIQNAYLNRSKHPNDFFSSLPTGGFTSKEALAASVYIFSQAPKNIMKALYMAIHSSVPKSEKGMDSDTIAHMVGALVGSHAGLSTLPVNWINSVEGNESLKELTKKAISLLKL